MPRAGDTKKESRSKEDSELAAKALLNAVVNESNTRPFLNLFGAATSNANVAVQLKPDMSIREQRQLLLHTVKHCLTTHKAREFFDALKKLVNAVIEQQEYIPEAAFDDDDDNHEQAEGDDRDIVLDQKSTAGLQFLHYAALCVTQFIKKKVTEPVCDTAILLHDCLDQIDPAWGTPAAHAQAAICSLCETWWLADSPRKEEVILQALPVVTEAALLCHETDIKRLYNLRSALQVIDFDDDSSEAFTQLLLRVSSSPVMLKSREGKRFVSHLFLYSMRSKLHQSIRAQIPSNKASILQDYGEIYFYAWKSADTQTRLVVESEVLQDLVYACIHVGNPGLHKSLMTVMQKFHDAQLNADVEALLYRLYGPVLWRSLRAANAVVRVQAAHVLAEVFPLRDQSDTSFLAKGVACVKALLQDADPRVRVAGSEALAKILTLYWDVVPSNDIRVLLNHLVAEHASDATSSAVRAGAVNAVTVLLAAPQSHAVLRELLPALGNLIHDKVEKVRLAVVRMLLLIKKVPNIKYYHIVPLDHLAARFAEEGKHNPTNRVAAALTGLMVNSYFPVKADCTEQVRRTLKFVTDEPEAAVVFYANLSKFRPVNDVAQLTVQLLRCLYSSVQTEHRLVEKAEASKGKRRRVSEDGEENDAEDAGSLPSEVMASLAETISVLWESIEEKLQDYDEWNQFLVDEFSGPKLTSILSYFERKSRVENDDDVQEQVQADCYRACSAVLRCAGRLPATAVEGLVPYITCLLSNLEESVDSGATTENVTAYIALLCLWDMTDSVAETLSTSISSAFREDDSFFGSPSAGSKKRRSRRSNGAVLEVPQLPADIALKVLGDVLRGSDPTSVAAREAIFASQKASTALETALEQGTRNAEYILDGNSMGGDGDVGYLLQVCEAFGRFVLHKEAAATSRQISFCDQAKMLLSWTTTKVVPAISSSSSPAPFTDPNLSSIHVEKSFDAFPASPEPQVRSRRRANRNSTPERLDEGLGILDDSPSTAEAKLSAIRAAQAFAVSLMNSSCILFAEWLAVGSSGADSIAQASASWCELFTATKANAADLGTLLPAFCRLAVQLGKAGEFAMLKQLLLKFNDGTNDTAPVRKGTAALLGTRGKQAGSIVKATVECVLEAAYDLLRRHDNGASLDFELPSSLGALFWFDDAGCVSSGLAAILGNQPASLEFARLLVDRFPSDVSESTGLALFGMKCLWLLCDPEGGSRIVVEASGLVRQIDCAGLEENLGAVVTEILGGLQTTG